jgi:Frag1/DRAM/Sfk1 family
VWSGIVSAVMLDVLATFQSKNVPEVHYPAAILFFVVGNIYMLCTAVVALRQRRLSVVVGEAAATEPMPLIVLRFVATAAGTLSFLFAVMFGVFYSVARDEGSFGGHSWEYWWQCAAVCEYSMVFWFCWYVSMCKNAGNRRFHAFFCCCFLTTHPTACFPDDF